MSSDPDLPVRNGLPHSIPEWVPGGSWFFISINCHRRDHNQLCQEKVAPQILSAVAHNHEHLVWNCRLFLLMPDHVHAILAFGLHPGMETIIKHWKKFVAGRFGVKWQRGFFDHRLRDHHELEEKTSYILNNPVRKGLCAKPEQWKWIYRPN